MAALIAILTANALLLLVLVLELRGKERRRSDRSYRAPVIHMSDRAKRRNFKG